MKKDLGERLRIAAGSHFRLSEHDPDDTGYVNDKETGRAIQQKNTKRLADLHDLLYAERKHAVLILLQGMDASGKDGTIKHVMSGVNPTGCTVTSFKVPTAEESAHDFLWRIHKAVPQKGYIGIFNRSQYEDVLVPRVHKLLPESILNSRYDRINEFEQLLVETDVVLLKFSSYQQGRAEEAFRRTKARGAQELENLERGYAGARSLGRLSGGL
jgi:polyphosphate kinase 2 (PPK2 family)